MGSVSAECHRALLYHLPVEGHVLALRYLVCVHVIARTSIVIYRRIMNACTVDRFFRLLALSTNALHCMMIPYCTYLAYLPWMPERENKLPRACGW